MLKSVAFHLHLNSLRKNNCQTLGHKCSWRKFHNYSSFEPSGEEDEAGDELEESVEPEDSEEVVGSEEEVSLSVLSVDSLEVVSSLSVGSLEVVSSLSVGLLCVGCEEDEGVEGVEVVGVEVEGLEELPVVAPVYQLFFLTPLISMNCSGEISS